jgi:ectoine hydroxylase-related dioxygenase (phytanoyl-CoA dioxygenase family)
MEEMKMAYKVSESDKQIYEDDGVVCLRGVIDPAVCSKMLKASYDFMEAGDAGAKADVRDNGGRYFSANTMSNTVPVFKEFALHSPLPSVAGQLMSTDRVRFFYDQVFLVEPGTQRSTPWHNDLAYWPFEGNDIVSLWVALTPVTSESSPLQYVAGSHKDKVVYRVSSLRTSDPKTQDPTLTTAPDYGDPANQAGKRIVSWEMQPGDVLAHHPLALHGAKANTSKGLLRCGLSLRYLGKDVIYRPRKYVSRPRDFDAVPGEYPADDKNLPLLMV